MPPLACPTCLHATAAPFDAGPLAGFALGASLLAIAAVALAGFPPRSRRVPVRAPRVTRPVAPDDVEGLLRNGQAATRRLDHGEALAWYNLALRASPGLPIALFCRGLTLLALGRAEEAHATLRDATRADPAEAAFRVCFAHVALHLGRHHEAMDALEPILAAEPEVKAQLLADPRLGALRDHPRFLAMLGDL